jgi:hypothetical protein
MREVTDANPRRADNPGMGIHIALAVAIMLAAVPGQAVKPLPTIEVTAPPDLAAVKGLSDTLGTLSEKVTACVDAGGKAEVCRCRYPQELAGLRKGYAGLVQQHPDWKDQMLSYRFIDKDGRNIGGTLILQSLRRQLETLKCD